MTGVGETPMQDFDDTPSEDNPAAEDVREFDRVVDELRDRKPALLESTTRARSLADAEADRAHQQNHLRERFFAWTRWVVAGALSANFGIFSAYMVSQWHHVSDQVMIAWIGATVIEVLGVALIIAKYLFGDSNPPPSRPTTD